MQLKELERRLKACSHIGKSIKLDNATTIIDVPEFIDNHLGFAETYEPMDPNNPYKGRLIKLLSLLEGKSF
jgi:hypothetical protein